MLLTPPHAQQPQEVPPPVRNLRAAFDGAISPAKLRLTMTERLGAMNHALDRLTCILVVAMGVLAITQFLSTFLIVSLLRDSFVAEF